MEEPSPWNPLSASPKRRRRLRADAPPIPRSPLAASRDRGGARHAQAPRAARAGEQLTLSAIGNMLQREARRAREHSPSMPGVGTVFSALLLGVALFAVVVSGRLRRALEHVQAS